MATANPVAPANAPVTRPERESPPAAPPVTQGDAPARLSLRWDGGDRTTSLDGGWWPRTTSLVDELPDLVLQLRRRELRISRVTYNPTLWDPAPRRVDADGHVVRLGWFMDIDPHLVRLSASGGEPSLRLLVVPPDTAAGPAARAMEESTGQVNHASATSVLARANANGRADDHDAAPQPRQRKAGAAGTESDLNDSAVWESEGGQLS